MIISSGECLFLMNLKFQLHCTKILLNEIKMRRHKVEPTGQKEEERTVFDRKVKGLKRSMHSKGKAKMNKLNIRMGNNLYLFE